MNIKRMIMSKDSLRKLYIFMRDKRIKYIVKRYEHWRKVAGNYVGMFVPYMYEVNQTFRADGNKRNWFHTYQSEGKYFSQCGQDFLVNYLFGDKDTGVFVDIGGNDPVFINNTYYFERGGWSGIAIEPLKKQRDKWTNVRKTRCLPYAVGNEEKVVIFQETAKDYLSKKKDVEFVDVVKGDDSAAKIVSTFKVEQKKLSTIFDDNNIHDIDYMSIDIEGAELDALKSIDWPKTKIKIISIENEDGEEMIWKIRNFLLDKGFYYFARLSDQEDIFINKESFCAIEKES